MGEILYLDSARLGRMSRGARQTHHAFIELAGEEGGSAYFDRFFQAGLAALPIGLQDQHCGLARWQGVGSLKNDLQRLTDQHKNHSVLLANRSAQLMKLTARVLLHTSRNVLVTDLDWPGYQEILIDEARRTNRAVTIVPLRRAVFNEGVEEDELIERVRAAFSQNQCDGVFLTAVSSDGIRLPVGRMVRVLEASHRVWFVGVDGAQDFCHIGADLQSCDLYLAGAHKWLGACLPLGIGLYGRRRSKARIETVMAHMLASGDLDDPLLRYCCRPEGDSFRSVTETTNLTPLFSCQGAVDDGLSEVTGSSESLLARLSNWETASKCASQSGWQPISPTPGLRSGILLLCPQNPTVCRQRPEVIREAFRDRGVSLSAYPEGVIRLSMPSTLWTPHEQTLLMNVLHSVQSSLGT